MKPIIGVVAICCTILVGVWLWFSVFKDKKLNECQGEGYKMLINAVETEFRGKLRKIPKENGDKVLATILEKRAIITTFHEYCDYSLEEVK